MKKVLIAFVGSILLLSACDQKDDVIDVNIRVKNDSNIDYIYIGLSGDGGVMEYFNIAPDSISEYRPYNSRIMPGTYYVITPNDTTGSVLDFVLVGEGLQNGFHTMEFNRTQLVTITKD